MQTYRVIVLLVAIVGLPVNCLGTLSVLKDIVSLRRRRMFHSAYRTAVLKELADELVWAFLQASLVVVGALTVFHWSAPLTVRTLLLLLSLLATLRSFNAWRARNAERREWNEKTGRTHDDGH